RRGETWAHKLVIGPVGEGGPRAHPPGAACLTNSYDDSYTCAAEQAFQKGCPMALSTESRKALSIKQNAIISFIRGFIDDNNYPPSIRDIQEGCDISSTSVVDYNLKALDRLGYIR